MRMVFRPDNPSTAHFYRCLMAKLYTKVTSDIRANLGIRGDKRMESSILFSHSGGRSADGGVRVIASATKTGYSYKILSIKDSIEEVYGVLNFEKGR